MVQIHDFHTQFNTYNPNSKKPWLVENSVNCVVCRHTTEEEATQCAHYRDTLEDGSEPSI